MKKSKIRSITWVFMVAISLSSFLYLKSIPVENYQEYMVESTTELDQEDVEEQEILVPTIALVKKVIDFTKVVFHK